ncbi:MAG: type II secretion system protein [Fusobacterium sp.]|uniref:type II secretion system protein n=1 Tax=Fusobacterium sp. TaxID=68766 RepID=UPI0026DB55CA|nr:type II secretion system protein [Fusobacterium sp.]MDO4690585.1 type II secretion system protein [Fusobacterium sp.]
MYIHKNKALSFLEAIISISILMIVSSILLSLIKPISKTFYIFNDIHKIEKNIFSFRQLINNHLLWNKNPEIRVLNFNSTVNLPSFSKIFSNPSEEKGNILIIKYNFYNKLEKKIEIKYRCFSFLNNCANISYFDAYDIFILSGIFSSSTLVENCNGEFILKNKNLKVIIKDLKTRKIYEKILFIP